MLHNTFVAARDIIQKRIPETKKRRQVRMNGDIVDRLRSWVYDVHAVPVSDLLDEAAEEIERLRAELKYQRARADVNDHAEELAELRRTAAGCDKT